MKGGRFTVSCSSSFMLRRSIGGSIGSALALSKWFLLPCSNLEATF